MKTEKSAPFRVQVQFNTGTQVHKSSKGKGSYKRNKGKLKNELKKAPLHMSALVA